MTIIWVVGALFVGVLVGVFITSLARMGAEPTPSQELPRHEAVPLDDDTSIRRAYFS